MLVNPLRFFAKFFVLVCLGAIGINASAESDRLLTIEDLKYEGAFRLPGDVYGDSRLGFANGSFSVSEDGLSLFTAGKRGELSVGEFVIPEVVNSTIITELRMAELPRQNFLRIDGLAPTGNPQKVNLITGVNHLLGQLIVNFALFYDANNTVSHTTLVAKQANNLSTSTYEGFFTLEGKVHSAGWLSEIPKAHRQRLASNYITGFAGNLPINLRNSIGPTAFLIDETELLGAKANEVVQTTPLIDYSLENPLHEDRFNDSGTNNLWTEVSKAFYGFIVPGTNTYLIVGSSGGHESGIGYKITQDDGTICGGSCPRKASDHYTYLWMYNVDDMLKVKNGEMAPHEPRPYLAGKLDVPFQPEDALTKRFKVAGADYHAGSNRLYMLLSDADTIQARFEKKPMMLVYSLPSISRPSPVKGVTIKLD